MISSYALRTVHRRGVSSLSSRVEPTVFRSARLGYAISWGRFWQRQPDAEENAEPSTEVLALQDLSGRTQIRVVCADRCETLDPKETIQFWRSPFYLDRFMEPGSLVAIADHNHFAGAVVIVSPEETGDEVIVTIKETYPVGSRTSVRVTLTTPLDSFDEAYRMAQETLQIDSRAMFRFFSRDILSAVLE